MVHDDTRISFVTLLACTMSSLRVLDGRTSVCMYGEYTLPIHVRVFPLGDVFCVDVGAVSAKMNRVWGTEYLLLIAIRHTTRS